MRQTGLVRLSMPLLGGIAVRQPQVRPVIAHDVAHHGQSASGSDVMDDGLGAAEHSMEAVGALDADARLAVGHHLGAVQRRQSRVARAVSQAPANCASARRSMFIKPRLTLRPNRPLIVP